MCSFKKCRLFSFLSDDPAVQSIIQLLIVNFGILSSAKRGLVRIVRIIKRGIEWVPHLPSVHLTFEWVLRVWGEGSQENLRHVLLAKGHQEQRQALIG